jgi:glycogen synthase
MRVALLSRGAHPLHAPGGLERAVYHLAKHLRAQGVDTVLLTRPATTGDESFPGDVVTVPYGPAHARHGGVVDRSLRYPRFADRLGRVTAELVGRRAVDVVHAQGLTALGYGRRRRSDPTLAAPLVMNPQGMEEHKTRGLKRLALTRLRVLSREAARLSDRVIATDEATRDEVRRLLGVDPGRVRVLPNGVDPEEIRAATPVEPSEFAHRALVDLHGADPVLLSVGRLERYKGFRDVLESLGRVAGALPPRWAWVVVGEGPEREALERDSAAFRETTGSPSPTSAAPRHILFAGRVDEALLHALYERADVFVHATRFEGSSLVTLEAMAHGLPVVATRAGGIPDKVSVESGRLVEPGDTRALGDALLELAQDRALRRILGERGREKALQAFAWPEIARKIIAVYEELLGERPR